MRAKKTVRLTFLGSGTSQGVPMIGCRCAVCRSSDPHDKRLRSSVMFEVGEMSVSSPVKTDESDTAARIGESAALIRIVVDTGPDFRTQMLRENVGSLDAILYTHGHKDHTGGMDDLRALNYIMQRPVDVYCEPSVEKVLRKDYDYAFNSDRYTGVPEVVMHTIGEKPFFVKGLSGVRVKIEPIRGLHFKLPVLGFRIGGIAYLTDMNSLPPESLEKLKGVDTLVINALRRKAHISHFTLDEALALIRQIGPRKAYITHISHEMPPYAELLHELPEEVYPAYDGLKIEVRQ